MRFGEKLRLAREARGLTQQQLADKLHLSRAAISLYEAGLRKVGADDTPLFAEALGLDESIFDTVSSKPIWAEVEEALSQVRRILLAADNPSGGSVVNPEDGAVYIEKTGTEDVRTIRNNQLTGPAAQLGALDRPPEMVPQTETLRKQVAQTNRKFAMAL